MLKITPIPALADNYIWAVQKENEVIIVDPGASEPVFAFFAKNPLNLTAILLTHNHSDHTGGVSALLHEYPGTPVYGPQETMPFADHIVKGEDHFTLFGYDIRVIESAGHTAGHISYLFGHDSLFCGDALFSGGCGRVFTGDYQAQFDTLQRFKALPEFVKVFPAHEYTQSNLKFAVAVSAPNCVLSEYQEQVDILRSRRQPTLPTDIGREMQVNPFMQATDLAHFTALRKQKDQC